MGYEYAEVYADAVRESLVAALADELGLLSSEDAVAPVLHNNDFEVEFRRNPDADAESSHFLAYPTIIEVATLDGAENRNIVGLIERVVAAVREQGHATAAAADFEAELASAPQPAQATYYARVDETHPRSDPRGVVRRRILNGATHDEAFTRNLKWEPTDYLQRYQLGHNDIEHVEITKVEADSFISRMTRKLSREQ